MAHLPAFRIPHSLRLLLCAMMLLSAHAASSAAADTAAPAPKSWNPDVLVLVMPGLPFPDSEQVAINYTAAVPEAEVRRDIDAIARAAGWQVSSLEVSTQADGTPGSKPTTSASFTTSGIISSADGAFYVEPFILGLKRFDSLDINYINVPQMEFRGLKDFENRFVKITMSQSGNAYRYRVQVKNEDFDKLGLPFAFDQKQPEAQGPSGVVRTAFIIACALLAALIVYIVASRFSQAQKPRGE